MPVITSCDRVVQLVTGVIIYLFFLIYSFLVITGGMSC
uniref:Uncharacterized protein n=1 Tax=Anguilla anguilla TaxID=7936 RepID=A0A0E9WW53_ANGAN